MSEYFYPTERKNWIDLYEKIGSINYHLFMSNYTKIQRTYFYLSIGNEHTGESKCIHRKGKNRILPPWKTKKRCIIKIRLRHVDDDRYRELIIPGYVQIHLWYLFTYMKNPLGTSITPYFNKNASGYLLGVACSRAAFCYSILCLSTLRWIGGLWKIFDKSCRINQPHCDLRCFSRGA